MRFNFHLKNHNGSVNQKKPFIFYKLGKNPQNDWYLLLTVFLALSLFFSLFSFFVYQKIEKGEYFSEVKNTNTDTVKIDQEALDLITKRFENKKEVLNKIEGGRSKYVDPSI